MTTEDRRAAQNTEFIFYKYKKYQLDFIKGQADFAMRFVRQEKKYTASEVLNDDDRINIATIDNGFFFYKNLRNSPQFLHQKKRELFATIRQLGIPTFFVSLSAADTRWKELLQCLGKIVDKKTYTLEEIENMTFDHKTRLINSDPVTCARFFDRRFQFFLFHILYKHPYPLGRISNHFYRIEFQHRGSPHVHMILFCSDAPKYIKDGDQSSLTEYIDRFISCSLNPEEKSKPFVKYQLHKHSKTCRKYGAPICRFHYPLPPFEQTIILEPNKDHIDSQKAKYIEIQHFLDSEENTEQTTLSDLLARFNLTFEDYVLIVRSALTRTKVFIKRKPIECRVNMYMKNLLYVWQANMDCQFCLDPYSVVAYIVNYINKENRGLSLNLQQMTKQCEKQKCNIRDTVKKLGNVFANSSEVCVQECIYILLGLPLAHQSTDVYFINTAPPEKRTKVLKNKKELEKELANSQNIYKEDKYEIYANRPQYFKNWCFAEYVCRVSISTRTKTNIAKQSIGIYTGRNGNTYYLDNKKRYSIGRRRILSYCCPPLKKDPEEHYRIQILLFYPWTFEPTLTNSQQTFSNMYTRLTTEEKENIKYITDFYVKENLENLHDIYSEMVNDVTHLVVSGNIDQTEAEDLEAGSRCLTAGTFFKPTTNNMLDQDINTSGDININVNTTLRTINEIWPLSKLCDSVSILNKDQRCIFDHIMKHLCTCDDQMFYFITGGAGAGKSVLLQTLYHGMSRYYNLDPNHNPSFKSILKVSPTGKSAYIIKGQTIHAGLGVKPAESYEHYVKLPADRFNTLHMQFQNTKAILFDEISMVGTNFFRFIDLRLQEITGNHMPFGGLHIICFGDLYQLPPVKDTWIFENNKYGLRSLAQNQWVDLFKIYELTIIMRQREEKDFAALLNRMRIGNLSDKDLNVLYSRNLTTNEFSDNLDCLHLFSKNVSVRSYNSSCFNKCSNEKTIVQSVDTLGQIVSQAVKIQVQKELDKDDDNSGTSQFLQLGIGLTYELNTNLNVQDGLANGTSGILKYIQYMPAFDKPTTLWFEFEHEDVGKVQRHTFRHYLNENVNPTWTPIFAMTREFKIKSPRVLILRKQFPVQQSTGKTVHKAQGCTVQQVAVCLSEYIFRNAYYVACSRVPHINGLHLLNFHPSQIKTDPRVDKEMNRLHQYQSLQLNFEIFPDTLSPIYIYYCNIQSLYSHHQFIINDYFMQNCNVILLNETHLTSSDLSENFQLQNYNLIRFDGIVTASKQRPFNGLAIYVKNYLDIVTLKTCRKQRYEYIINGIHTKNENIIIVLFYVSPQTNQHDIRNMILEIMEFIQNIQNDFFFILGDLNVDYEKHVDFIDNLGDYFDLYIGPNTYSTQKCTCIDYCFTPKEVNINVHYIPWSHHFAFTVQLPEL